MNYLSPQIAKMAKRVPEKSLAKKGISCGIFQDVGEDPHKNQLKQKNS